MLFETIFPAFGARSHTKFGPDRFSRFDVYWIQKHTPRRRGPGKKKIVNSPIQITEIFLFHSYFHIISVLNQFSIGLVANVKQEFS